MEVVKCFIYLGSCFCKVDGLRDVGYTGKQVRANFLVKEGNLVRKTN